MSPEPSALDLDLSIVPWSRRGSYMTLSTNVVPHDHPGRTQAVPPGVYLFDVSGSRFFRWNGVFRLEGLEGEVAHELRVVSADPSRLVLGAAMGTVEVTWDTPDTLRFRGRNTGLRLVQAVLDPLESAIAFPRGPREWRLQMGEDAHYAATVLVGDLRVEAPRVRTGAAVDAPDLKVVDVLPGADRAFELALTQYQSGFLAPGAWRPFDACVADTAADYAAWLAAQLPVTADLEAARDLAAYVTWSSMVAPRGLLGRATELASKNWMFSTWGWDHCFHALGLVAGRPDLAWDQLMVLFDHQHPQGALPDIVNDATRMWGFVKPPVHGWTLRRLDAAGLVTDQRLAEIYPKLARWTDWWTTYRDADGLCETFHGNDGGWDNATAFDMGFPVVAPDIAAYLVVQMDVLAEGARRLGRPDEASVWRERADGMLAKLVERLWDGRGFVARRSDDGSTTRASRSLVPFMPLILGERLPAAIRATVVADLRGSGLLTEHGPATESPTSPLYEPDGYWRGPVWAPTTLLLVDGLHACGEHALADEVADRYLETCRRAGFAENFDAVTGAPLRDPAYTWSASVFLDLASERAARTKP